MSVKLPKWYKRKYKPLTKGKHISKVRIISLDNIDKLKEFSNKEIESIEYQDVEEGEE